MSPPDIIATLRLIADLWPAHNWPEALLQGVTARLASLPMTAEDARAALVNAHLTRGAARPGAFEVLQILAVAAATKAAAQEPKRVRDARRLTGLPSIPIAGLDEALYLKLLTRGYAWKHALQDVHAMLSDVAAAARPGPPNPDRAMRIERRIQERLKAITEKYGPAEAAR